MWDAIIDGIHKAIIQLRIDPYWETTAFIGEAVFAGRFVLQWLVSEFRKRSYVPVGFWYMSIIGSVILLAYAIHIQKLVFILAFSLQILIYGRNLHLIRREALIKADSGGEPKN